MAHSGARSPDRLGWRSVPLAGPEQARHQRSKFLAYAYPRQSEFVDQLPKTRGKIRRPSCGTWAPRTAATISDTRAGRRPKTTQHPTEWRHLGL